MIAYRHKMTIQCRSMKMASLNISLPEGLKAFVENEVRAGGYRTPLPLLTAGPRRLRMARGQRAIARPTPRGPSRVPGQASRGRLGEAPVPTGRPPPSGDGRR